MILAPFLTLQMLLSGESNETHTSLGGLFDLIYMLGWMCSIIGLIRLQAAGTKKSSTRLLSVQLLLLCIANVWNIWVIIAPTYNPPLFFVLDAFWPLSNLFMLVLGALIPKTSPFLKMRKCRTGQQSSLSTGNDVSGSLAGHYG